MTRNHPKKFIVNLFGRLFGRFEFKKKVGGLILEYRIICYYLLCGYTAYNLVGTTNNHILTS